MFMALDTRTSNIEIVDFCPLNIKSDFFDMGTGILEVKIN